MQLEAVAHITTAKVWQNLGQVVQHAGVAYIDWPLTSLVGSIIAEITGLDLFHVATIVTLVVATMIGIGSYLFFLVIFQSNLYAALACLLVIIGNLTMIIYYKPGQIAIMFVVFFLLLLVRKGTLTSPSHIILALLLLMGTTITHVHTSMFFFFILLGLWIFALLKRNQETRPDLISLTLFFIIPIFWVVYWGTSGFSAVSRWSWTNFQGALFKPEWLSSVISMGQANFGSAPPEWYRITRLFWLVLLYAMGGLLLLRGLTRFRRLKFPESWLCAAFVGVGILGILSCLTSPLGLGELKRITTYIPLFTAPLLLLFLRRFKQSVANVGLVTLAIVLGLFSFPSFLTNNSQINSNSYHPIEFSAGEWLQSLYGTGAGLNIFATAATYQPIQYYLFNASFQAERQTHEFKGGWVAAGLWDSMNDLVNRFNDTLFPNTIFIYSPKDTLERSMSFNIPYDDPHWAAMSAQLSNTHSTIYNNGLILVYSNAGQRN
ncbi:MAG: hypothetical protein Q7J73_10960 [Dehalococcoidales bacterium]|nr:hypothetical protein [Dehalococcoidales bacterium]